MAEQPRRYKMVDLFAGCGGISRGFERTQRFGTEFAAEIMPHPAKAFVANIRNTRGQPTRMYTGDVQALADDPVALWSELNAAGISEKGEVDVLAGGPPCQGFSRNGVRKYEDSEKQQRFFDDPRNHLYKAFLGIVESIRPKVVLVENVREFLNFKNGKFSADLMEKFDDLGYVADFRKVCAADYGVPQMRHRVFFVAVRTDVANAAGTGPVFPEPEFVEVERQLSLVQRPYRTVRDAIADLPLPSSRKSNDPLPYVTNGRLSEYAMLMRSPVGTVTNHFSRPLSPIQCARVQAVGAGRMKHIHKRLQTKAFYGSAYGRLVWDEPSLTITTWVYHVGSGRFAHPTEDRGITMREAARLQSFDDGFIFPPLVNPVSQMIGNAVPPLLAERFAQRFVEVLDRYWDIRVPQRRASSGGR